MCALLMQQVGAVALALFTATAAAVVLVGKHTMYSY